MTQMTDLDPKPLWEIFALMSSVPRGSGNEAGVMKALGDWAQKHRLAVKQDETGNMLISIPATPGREGVAPVLLQGHVDMVCEKNAATKHDFTKDPIRTRVEGDWVMAEGTTLGSDNGIGVAMGLATAVDPHALHGPVEVLLTVDEERGLTGAAGIKPGFFTAKRMINLDSEEDVSLFIGCAGGRDTSFTFTATAAKSPKESAGRKVMVMGLKGGHSGLDINLNRGNAIKILTRCLLAAAEEGDLRLVDVSGGSMRNAIPREATATVVIPGSKGRAFKQRIDAVAATIREELAGIDNELIVKVTTVQAPRCFSKDSSRTLMNLMAAIPNGVLAMSPAIPGLVETSSNLGVARTEGAKVTLVCCSRSSVMSSLAAVVQQHRAIGELAGAAIVQPAGYPGWKPNPASEMVRLTSRKYAEIFGSQPELKAIHAGLECGLLTEKYPDLDIVSFGPNIHGAHSPDEKVSVSSVQKVYRLLTGVLADLN